MSGWRKVLRGTLIGAGVVLLLAIAAVATVLVNGVLVANAALADQRQRLVALQERVAELPGGVFDGWQETPIDDRIPWDRVQAVASHNSYAIAPNAVQNAVLALARPGEPEKLAYSHPPLWQQLEQGIRSFELDLRVHSNGDLRLTHVPVLANASNAPDFRLSLDEIELWSASHPGHLPITVLVEFKSDYAFLDPSLADWTTERLAQVDDAIRSGLGERALLPAELIGDRWPAVGALRDRVLVILHPSESVERAYAGIPSDERSMFVAQEGEGSGPLAASTGPAFVVHNDPDPAAIAPLVEAGAIVRTRADADLRTDSAERDRAFDSGAQIISTDFPSPAAQQSTGYTVAFEGGALARVDPARAPSPEELRRIAAEAWVERATIRELAGSVVMASIPSTDTELLHRLMSESSLGGFILMGANVPGSQDRLRELTAALAVDPEMPPLVAIDEEGGVVKRLPWDSYAGADTLRRAPAAEVQAAFAGRAQLLAEAGVNVNFGIVADFTADSGSFIYRRTFGNDPAAASERVAAAVAGEHGLVASTLKHFPGHGAAPGDSHFAIPRTGLSLDAWRAAEAAPFRAGIEAGAELLMFGHLSYTSVTATPASLAPEWYAIARDELGFTGVAITDDLAMLKASGLPEYQDLGATAVAALAAGADIALVVAGVDYPGAVAIVDRVAAAAESGELPEERLREAAIRVAELRLLIAERLA